MEYSFRQCSLDDFDFLFNLKKENFKRYVDKIRTTIMKRYDKKGDDKT